MPWNDNKIPVHFGRYRRLPWLFGSKFGWFFHHGVDERINLSTMTLARLLKEEKAYLVIDKDEWEKQVQKYRGHNAQSEQQQKLAKLQQQAQAKMNEYKKIEKILSEKTVEAGKYANRKDPKDAQKAAKVFLEITEYRKRRDSMKEEIQKLQKEYEQLKKAA